MKRKFVLTSIIAAVISFSANAQDFSVEATAGMNFSNYHYTDKLNPGGVGFRVGAIGQLDIPQVDGLYANAGLLLSLESAKATFEESLPVLGTTTSVTTISPWTLNIPIHAGYQYDFSNDLGVFVEAGPYFGVGLWGNYGVKISQNDTVATDKQYDVFSEDSGMNRFQFGLGIKLGVLAYGNYKVSFGWDWNLLDINSQLDNSQSHNVGYLSLSYAF